MPWKWYWYLSYHLARQLSRLLLIRSLQRPVSSIPFSAGLMRFQSQSTAILPLTKQGMVDPCAANMALTSTMILSLFLMTALNPFAKQILNFLKDLLSMPPMTSTCSDSSLKGTTRQRWPLGLLDRKKPKSMWMMLPSRVSRILPLCRSLICRKQVTREYATKLFRKFLMARLKAVPQCHLKNSERVSCRSSSFFISPSRVITSGIISMMPQSGPIEITSQGRRARFTPSLSKIWQNWQISCIANCSCLRLSPVLTIRLISFQEASPPNTDLALNRASVCSMDSPKISSSSSSFFSTSISSRQLISPSVCFYSAYSLLYSSEIFHSFTPSNYSSTSCPNDPTIDLSVDFLRFECSDFERARISRSVILMASDTLQSKLMKAFYQGDMSTELVNLLLQCLIMISGCSVQKVSSGRNTSSVIMKGALSLVWNTLHSGTILSTQQLRILSRKNGMYTQAGRHQFSFLISLISAAFLLASVVILLLMLMSRLKKKGVSRNECSLNFCRLKLSTLLNQSYSAVAYRWAIRLSSQSNRVFGVRKDTLFTISTEKSLLFLQFYCINGMKVWPMNSLRSISSCWLSLNTIVLRDYRQNRQRCPKWKSSIEAFCSSSRRSSEPRSLCMTKQDSSCGMMNSMSLRQKTLGSKEGLILHLSSCSMASSSSPRNSCTRMLVVSLFSESSSAWSTPHLEGPQDVLGHVVALAAGFDGLVRLVTLKLKQQELLWIYIPRAYYILNSQIVHCRSQLPNA